jgi:arylsulfatase A-like enzyme
MKLLLIISQILFLLAVSGFNQAKSQKKREKNQKPNILFILVDDMSYNGISCYGQKPWKTPHIDKIAERGMRFSTAYVSCVCSPTRASIMTGKYPERLGITNWIPGGANRYKNPKLIEKPFQQFLPDSEITIAEVLKKGGYQTAMVGKWHLGTNLKYMPDKQGFDYQYMISPANPTTYFVERDSIQTKGFFDNDAPGREFLSDHLADKAIEWLKQPKTRPWFMYFATYAVHMPIEAKDSLIQKYLKMGLPKEGVDAAKYAAMHEHMDEAVGRVLQYLDDNDLRKNTLIIFLSDNGGREPETVNTPFRGGKGELLEGGLRVPLIFEWDGKIAPGTINKTPIGGYDLFPTILDLAGFAKPSHLKFDGISMKDILLNNNDNNGLFNRAFYWNYPHYTGKPYGKPSNAIVKGDWELIHFIEDDSKELYNLKTNIAEKNNLIEKYPKKAEELYHDLNNWLKEVNAKIPDKNPSYNPLLPSGWPQSLID